MKRLLRDPRARVAPCGMMGRVTGTAVEGRARVVDDSTLVERAYAALNRKYGWQMSTTDLVSRLAGRYDNRAMLEIEFA